VLAAVLTVASAVAVVPSLAAAAPRAARVAIAPSTAQQIRSFWTPARMRAAKPLEVRPATGSAGAPAGRGGSEGGTPRRIQPAPPSASASASSTFDQVADPAAAGLCQNGVIFFEIDGDLARCSGTSVNAPNRSVVITAGHCIDGGEFGGHAHIGRWVFVPGYRFGQRPFGIFPAKWLDTTRGWGSDGGENFDVGAAVVARNESGQRLGAAVGGAGIAWNLKANQVFDVHGYPVAPPFDGETQRLCAQTPFLGHDPTSFVSSGPLNLAVDCNVTGGASGGGWTIAGNLLNGVTDYGYPDDPATDFGAYFGKEVARLYKRAGAVR
jgi:V8-like Glu-specific endopeptidase